MLGARAQPAQGLAVWKGDRVAACVAAASVLAKVTRDRVLLELHETYTPDAYCRCRQRAACTMMGGQRSCRPMTGPGTIGHETQHEMSQH